MKIEKKMGPVPGQLKQDATAWTVNNSNECIYQ